MGHDLTVTEGRLALPTETVAAQAVVTTSGPVAAGERVDALDVLRGVALFGVFLMNVEGFAGHRPARSTIGVAALPAGGAVEIEAWAFKPLSK